MQFRVISLTLIVFLLNSCSNTSIRDREYLSLLGEVIIRSEVELPENAQLHVLLTENNPNEVEDEVIATDSKELVANETSLSFAVPYRSDAINEDSEYLLLACVTVEDKVLLISNNDTQVLTQGYSNTSIIELNKQLQYIQGDGRKSFSKQRSIIQRGVQTNLADVCRQKLPGYDHITRAKASKILPEKLLNGPLHQVSERVDIHGPHYFFVIDSEYGQFTAQGIAMLNKVIREIYAIEALMKITRSDAYLDVAGESFVTPFAEVKELVTNPIDTITGIPKGAFKIVNTTFNTLTTARSQYEDSYIEALITVSKYKRRHAKSLGVDVYSSNPLLQRELDRLAWVEAMGNWTPSVVLLPLSGPGMMAYSAFSWTETLNRALIEKSPDILRDHNERELRKLGIPLSLRKRLLGHGYFSPRHATILTKALVDLHGAKGLERFVEEVVKAESELDALSYQQIAELLADYHRDQQKIVELSIHKGLPVGFSQDGTLITTLPVDYLRWTPFSESVIKDVDSVIEDKSTVKNKVIWIVGSISPLAKLHLEKLRFEVSEQIKQKVEMMD